MSNKSEVEGKITLTGDEIERLYGVDRGTLANYRTKRIGCRYFKVGAKVYYKTDEFERWFFSRPVLTADCLER